MRVALATCAIISPELVSGEHGTQEMKTSTESNGTFTWREVFFIFAMCLAIFLTRLPWIAVGYGTDHDAYWVINEPK
jgi:hypothetical protein